MILRLGVWVGLFSMGVIACHSERPTFGDRGPQPDVVLADSGAEEQTNESISTLDATPATNEVAPDASASGANTSFEMEPLPDASFSPSGVGDGGADHAPEELPSPQLDGPCEQSGRRACNGAAQDQLLLCSQGRWQGDGLCDSGQHCDQNTGRCAEVPSQCDGAVASTAYCSETARMECGADLLGVELEPCSNGCEMQGEIPTCAVATCGDNLKEFEETCDDGNSVSESTCDYGVETCIKCSADCSQEWSLTGPYCGDTITSNGEVCDTTATWCQACTVVPVLTAGDYHNCALLPSGAVKCWGYGEYGQIGNEDTTDESVPVDVSDVEGVSSVAAGGYHSCALLTSGAVKCWGYGTSGQLGNDNTSNQTRPVDVADLTDVSAVAAGGYHSCALLTSGAVKCWGLGSSGQLGNGDAASQPTPVDVSGLAGVSSITAGDLHTCALLTSGAVKCWGYGSNGELGNGDTTNQVTPVDVSELTDVSSIAAGEAHTCALLTSGAVKCWGYGSNGQLGNGDILDQTTPVDVLGLTGVSFIAAGAYHTCAVLTSGGVTCWGRADDGQLGSGDSSDQTTPVDVLGLTGASTVAAGSSHTCALLTSNVARCWGGGDYGQLGDGDATSNLAPVDVVGLP